MCAYRGGCAWPRGEGEDRPKEGPCRWHGLQPSDCSAKLEKKIPLGAHTEGLSDLMVFTFSKFVKKAVERLGKAADLRTVPRTPPHPPLSAPTTGEGTQAGP